MRYHSQTARSAIRGSTRTRDGLRQEQGREGVHELSEKLYQAKVVMKVNVLFFVGTSTR